MFAHVIAKISFISSDERFVVVGLNYVHCWLIWFNATYFQSKKNNRGGRVRETKQKQEKDLEAIDY